MKPDYSRDGIELYHADCLDVLPHVAGTVDAIVTSPPYAEQRDYGGEMAPWDDMMDALWRAPWPDHCQILVNIGLIHRGECLPYWEPWRERMRAAGWRFFGWYVWDQGSGLPGDWVGRLSPSHEFVFHFNRKNRKPNKWIKCKCPGRQHTSSLRNRDGTVPVRKPSLVQEHKIPDSVIRVTREMRRGTDHPAVFPVALPRHLVLSYTGTGDTVCDPFCGSGSSGVAAIRAGREFIGCEINEHYFWDICVPRIDAELDGRPWDPRPVDEDAPLFEGVDV